MQLHKIAIKKSGERFNKGVRKYQISRIPAA